MGGGWVKAHRAMLGHPLFQRADAMGVWMRLLMMAAHEPTRVFFRGKPVELDRGQVAISVLAMADDLGLTHKRMRLILGKLADDGSLKMDQAPGKAYTLVTICNYAAYQSSADTEGQSEGQSEGKRRANEGQTEQEPKEDSKNHTLPLPEARKPRTRRVFADTPEFTAFWDAYPHKQDKGAARKAWDGATKRAGVPDIMAGLERANAAWRSKRTELRYIPYPARWLNNDRWADEASRPTSAPPAQGDYFAHFADQYSS